MVARAEDPVGALFRREAGRMTSALVRLFGPHNLPLVEDVVNDALLRALEVWKHHGVPDNPAAWILAAAKNRAIDLLRKERKGREKAEDIEYAIASEASLKPAVDEVFADEALRDEQLRMMFACCHTRLPEEVQVALVLNLLGGFGMHEIAAAFLVGDAAMEKRIQRGKQTLAEAPGLLEVTPERVEAGLGAVHRALYLIFNEGYHGNHPEETVRAELCAEAIRLGSLLAESAGIATPETHALLALMFLTAARLPGGVDAQGELVPLEAQDRSLWDPSLVERGIDALNRSAEGETMSAYHVEAAIAFEHTLAPSHAQTAWRRIASHYDLLFALRPSPVVALSRAIALGELEGPDRALKELAAIDDRERLEGSPFYRAAVAEQQLRAGRLDDARASFRTAIGEARSPAERRFLERKLVKCG